MDWSPSLCLLCLLLPLSGPQQPQPELPTLVKKALDEFLAGKYLQALVDAFLFASKQQPWSPLDALQYLLLRNSSLNMERITTILRDYQNVLIQEPQRLVSDLGTLDTQQFTTALRLLFLGRKEQTSLIDVDFDVMKSALERSPGGNRSLFAVARERCVPALRRGTCVDLLGAILSLSAGEFVQDDFIAQLPADLPEDIFRNLTAVFKDLYDMFSAATQRSIYKWIIQGLQKTSKSNQGSQFWVTAENLWFLGRYIVHLAVHNINGISLSEMRMFINYDNATKQLDSVYDIKHATAKAFLRRVGACGFDMANTSIAYRLGLLVCFYDNAQQLDVADARSLLHQLIKCNQLRGNQADVQKLKSQLLAIVMRNRTLNESLGSVSDAVVGLTPSQLESLSAQAVQSSIAVLQQVSGWTRSQTIVLVHKYIGTSKFLSFSNISQLGSLISGVDANLFYSVTTEELSRALESTLSRYSAQLNPAQQHAIVSQMLTAADVGAVVRRIPGLFFLEVSLSTLLRLPSLETEELEQKQLTRSQAFFLYGSLSRRTSTTDLISTGQLLKGISCEDIQRMNSSSFVTNFTLFEKNFHLLSPFQMNCLAWKYWEVLHTTNTTIPPLLLSVLPVEYLDNMPTSSCKSFLGALGRVSLDLLTVYEEKQEAVIKKVLQCLGEGVRDEYDVDVMGQLLCHLPANTIRARIAPPALPAALRQFRSCPKLSQEQKDAVKSKMAQLYGSPQGWSAELAQDLGPLVTLLSREEITAIANKYPEEVLPLAASGAGGSLPEEFLAALFDSVRGTGAGEITATNPESAQCDAVRAPSVDEIRKLLEANVYWSDVELQCMSDDTFTQTVELLGSVSRYNMSQLSTLKTRAMQAWGALSTWKSYHVISLGAIALALTVEDIQELDLSSIDTLTALSQQTAWSPQQLSSLLSRFLETSGLTLATLRGSDLAGLGVILCGVEPSQVHLIGPAAYSATAARIGTLPCAQPVLRELKKTAERVFGAVGTWNSSVLQEVGAVAAGMTVEELRALRAELMPYLQPGAVAAIPPEHFRELSREQIQSLGPENAAAVTPSQCAHLSQEQLQGLQAARDGLRDSHVSANQSPGTVNSGTGQTLPSFLFLNSTASLLQHNRITRFLKLRICTFYRRAMCPSL
nr:PREDICTED: otoancorin isoform X1 [Lepisosteus oculatus]XP_015215579.1 PREDICTED: otoancorin isoform X1 [Lepisosteus oculatus]